MQEYDEDEWFMTETLDDGGFNNMIKLISQDDGSQRIYFFDETIEHKDYSIIAPNGDDSM